MTGARPPRIARLLLRLFVPRAVREFMLGDLEEEFAQIVRSEGATVARGWYWRQAIGSLFTGRPRSAAATLVPRRALSPRWLPADSLLQDARFAFRSFRNHPGFTAVATITLALGIGATTAIFSFANWLLIRPVPGVHDPGRLVTLHVGRQPQPGWFSPASVSYPNLADLVAATPGLMGLAGYQENSADVAVEGAASRHVRVKFTTANYFDVLGVVPTDGRTFVADDDRIGNPARVVVLSVRLRRQLFPDDGTAVGRTLRVNGEIFTIVGVAPPGFHGIERLGDVDVWLPGGTYGHAMHFRGEIDFSDRSDGVFHDFVGRLAPGAPATIVEQQLLAGMRGLAETYPEQNAKFEEARPFVYAGIGMPVLMREGVRKSVRLLMGIVVLVLLIAVANVANMMLFQGVRRRGETAVRRALGGTGGRLLRQHLTEGVLLSLIGGLAGVAVALLLTRWLSGSAFFGLPPVEAVRLDWRVLAFTFGTSVSAGILFSVAPAYLGNRVDLVPNLKDAARTGTGGTPYLRGSLLTIQLAASLALVVGGLLFARTLRSYARVDLGFEPRGLHAFLVSPGTHGYSDERMREYYRVLLDRLESRSEITEAAVAPRAPLWGASFSERLYLPGQNTGRDTVEVTANAVSPTYFRTLGTPMLRGRPFRDHALAPAVPGSESVIILNRAAARRLFGERDPVGRYVLTPRTMMGPEQQHLVVGVVADSRWSELAGEPEPQAFQPFGMRSYDLRRATIFVRSPISGDRLEMIVQEVAAGLDPALPLHNAQSMMETIGRRLSQERLFTKTLTLLAVLALTLAAVGLYGVVAHGVAERTREFGIRMAMGAERRDILRMVLRGAMTLTAAGVVLGIGGSVALTRVIGSRLYGVSPVDAPSFLTAVIILVAVALAASVVPARTATRTDPMAALRYE